MKKDRSYGSEYQKELLKIGWEAVRRSKEYRDDFQKIMTGWTMNPRGRKKRLPPKNGNKLGNNWKEDQT